MENDSLTNQTVVVHDAKNSVEKGKVKNVDVVVVSTKRNENIITRCNNDEQALNQKVDAHAQIKATKGSQEKEG